MLGGRSADSNVKLPASKTEMREKLEEQVREFLGRGGAVQAVARGASGRDDTSGVPGFRSFTQRPKEERTYVPEVVAAIEARRHKPRETKRAQPGKPRLVRKAIYDDFGEPIRWEWVDKS